MKRMFSKHARASVSVTLTVLVIAAVLLINLAVSALCSRNLSTTYRHVTTTRVKRFT